MMVRVGGGWETLEDYLERHVPNRSTIKAYYRPPISMANLYQMSINKAIKMDIAMNLINAH
jgi:hypothetical protein